MSTFIDQFHFVRPWFLLGLVLVPLIFVAIRRQSQPESAWSRVVDATLLKFLGVDQGRKSRSVASVLVSLCWLLATLAIAGPVWQKLELPMYRSTDVRMIVLNTSQTMLSTDIAPDRMSRARFKVLDILKRLDEGQVGLIAYTSEPFLVSPLTRDANTLTAMVPALDTSIMPVGGQDAGKALKMAASMIERVQPSGGQILLITDDASELDRLTAEDMASKGHRISVLGVGTEKGAPIRLGEGGFLKDSNGSIVIPKLDENMLYRLARSGGGQYARMTVDSTDIDAILLASSDAHAEIEETESLSRLWIEQGPWLLVLMLPFIALIFRRGYGLLAVLVLCLPVEENLAQSTEESTASLEAGAWESLWKRPNQIARESYDREQYERAANIAEDPFLEGMAYYRMDEFEVAERYFSQQDTADAHYNRGNALARQNKLEEGIAAYDRALTLDPDMEDAAYNKALLEQALKQQQEQQQQEQDDQNESDEQEQTESDQQETPEESEGESEEQQSEQQQSSEQESEQSEESELSDKELSEEEKQALEQWLRRVPDDPGGLLRRKFMLEHRRRLAEQAKRGSGS